MRFTVAPKIDRRNLKSITVREGEPILYDVRVSGEPAPVVTWSFNNLNVSTNSVYQIDNIPYNSRFYHSNPMRNDSGVYKIVAANKYGEDEAEVEVTVICKYQYKWHVWNNDECEPNRFERWRVVCFLRF